MNLQKLVKTTLVLFCISLSAPAFSNPGSGTEFNPGDGKSTGATIDPIKRIEEIKNMNKENLSRAERKALRKELREMRPEARANKNGIYLSVGAVIIVILLLILLL